MEDEVLLEGDGHPDGHPISHKRQEVSEDLRKMTATSKRAGSVDDNPDCVPNDARNDGSPAAENLRINTRRVTEGVSESSLVII
jgi:hypothetical protein